VADSNDYVKSIDNRLAVIEKNVCEMRGDLAGLKIRVAGISAVVSMIVGGIIKWVS
jgi:hypothetical protein